jgi:hypothetical protein
LTPSLSESKGQQHNMADPITKKIDTLPPMTGLVANNDELILMDVSESAVNMTKKMTMSQIPVSRSAQLTDGIVVESKLGSDAVTSTKLAAGAVIAGKIATGGVSASTQLADDVVTSAKILDGTIVAGNIADTTITGAKLVSKTITATQIADNTITAAHIATGGVGTDEIAAGAVTQAKLSGVVRTVCIPVYGDYDNVVVENHTRRFIWPNALDDHIIQRVSLVLGSAASSSGSVTVQVNNGGGTAATVSITAGAWTAETLTIDTNYKTAVSMAPVGINVTAAGSDAKGLSVYLEMLG